MESRQSVLETETGLGIHLKLNIGTKGSEGQCRHPKRTFSCGLGVQIFFM